MEWLVFVSLGNIHFFVIFHYFLHSTPEYIRDRNLSVNSTPELYPGKMWGKGEPCSFSQQ